MSVAKAGQDFAILVLNFLLSPLPLRAILIPVTTCDAGSLHPTPIQYLALAPALVGSADCVAAQPYPVSLGSPALPEYTMIRRVSMALRHVNSARTDKALPFCSREEFHGPFLAPLSANLGCRQQYSARPTQVIMLTPSMGARTSWPQGGGATMAASHSSGPRG